jgi:hypothetical protein
LRFSACRRSPLHYVRELGEPLVAPAIARGTKIRRCISRNTLEFAPKFRRGENNSIHSGVIRVYKRAHLGGKKANR